MTSKSKLIEYKQQGNITFKLLVQSQSPEEKISMKELMMYPLTPIPYSVGTADGMLLKTENPNDFIFDQRCGTRVKKSRHFNSHCKWRKCYILLSERHPS